MAITTLDGLIAGFLAQPEPFFKSFTPASGAYMSMWNLAGQPGAAASPSSGVGGDIPTDATAGAIPFTNATNTYLGHLAMSASGIGAIYLYDRLWQNSGLSATTTTSQTVNSVALDRPDANGERTELWWQCYAAMGSGAGGTQTAVYTNPAGTGSKTATLQGFATSAIAGRCFPFSLDTGDMGVKSVQSFTHTTTYTSGTFGLAIKRRLATIQANVTNGGSYADAFALGMPRVYDNACLEVMFLSNASAAMTISGDLTLAQG
jgi:hypothetical protein